MEAVTQHNQALQRAVRSVALGAVLTLAGFQLVSWAVPERFEMLPTDRFALISCSLALLLDLLSRHRAASWVLVVTGWVAVSWAVLSDDGLQSVSAVGFLPVLAMTVLVGGHRAAGWIMSGFVLLMLSILALQHGGLISVNPYASPITVTVRIIGSLTILWVILWWGLSRLERFKMLATEDRHRAMARTAKLQRQHRLIDEVVDCLPGALWVSDARLKRTSWLSPTWASLLGKSPSPGSSVAELFGQEEPPGDHIQIQHADGSPRWLRQHTVSRGEQVIGLVVDETAHRHHEQVLEQQAIRAQRARNLEAIGRLAGEAAHDTNNVLTIAKSMALLASQQLSSDHPARAELDEISACCSRASQRMLLLMAFAGQRPGLSEPIDLSEAVGRVESLLRLLLPETIHLAVSVGSHSGTVSGASGLLEQALVHLIDSASEHVERITLQVSDAGDRIALTLSPVSAEDARAVLAPFMASCTEPVVEIDGATVRLLLVAIR